MAIGCFGGLTGFDCSISWIIMILLFFIAAICRRQFYNLFSLNFSLIGGTALGEILFVAFLYVFNGMKFPFIIGLVGVFAGGFLGSIWDQSGEEGGFEE